MGWLYMPRSALGPHRSAKAYLDAQLTYERQEAGGGSRGLRVLASACVGNRVYYAAAEQITDGVAGDVFAIVCLVRWNPRDREGLIFGYKDMDETCGPCESGCPANILALLSPTDHPHALDWRQRCLATQRRRQCPLSDGMRIRLANPISFTDGYTGDEFVVERTGRRLRFRVPDRAARYCISGIRDRDWSVVAETKIHATIFA